MTYCKHICERQTHESFVNGADTTSAK